MRVSLYFIVFLGLSFSAFANVERFTPLSKIVVSGQGNYEDDFSLSFEMKYLNFEDKEIDTVTLSMAYGSFVSKEGEFDGVVNPLISNLSIRNDSGIMGTYYKFFLDYGELADCGKRRKLEIKQPFDRNAKHLEIRKIEPCEKGS